MKSMCCKSNLVIKECKIGAYLHRGTVQTGKETVCGRGDGEKESHSEKKPFINDNLKDKVTNII